MNNTHVYVKQLHSSIEDIRKIFYSKSVLLSQGYYSKPYIANAVSINHVKSTAYKAIPKRHTLKNKLRATSIRCFLPTISPLDLIFL